MMVPPCSETTTVSNHSHDYLHDVFKAKPRTATEDSYENDMKVAVTRAQTKWTFKAAVIFMFLHPKVFNQDADIVDTRLGVPRTTVLMWVSKSNKHRYVDKWLDSGYSMVKSLTSSAFYFYYGRRAGESNIRFRE